MSVAHHHHHLPKFYIVKQRLPVVLLAHIMHITSDQPATAFLGGGVTIEGGEDEDAAVDPSSLGSYMVRIRVCDGV